MNGIVRDSIIRPFIEGISDSITLANALVLAGVGGTVRTLTRIFTAFAEHRPLPVAPDRVKRTC